MAAQKEAAAVFQAAPCAQQALCREGREASLAGICQALPEDFLPPPATASCSSSEPRDGRWKGGDKFFLPKILLAWEAFKQLNT